MKNRYLLNISGVEKEVVLLDKGFDHIRFELDGKEHEVTIRSKFDEDQGFGGAAGADFSDGKLRAPIPGIISRLTAEEGQELEAGATLLVLEAMKMENNLSVPLDLKVDKILVAAGEEVSEGQVLVEFSS